jgi:hypothetical protein
MLTTSFSAGSYRLKARDQRYDSYWEQHMPKHLSNREYLLPVLTLVPAPATEFVAQWSKWYSYPREDIYTSNIGLPPYSDENSHAL